MCMIAKVPRTTLVLLAALSSGDMLTASPQPATRPARTSIEGSDLVSLLPPDGIPAISNPQFVSVSEAASFLRNSDPILGVSAGGEAKAYGLWYLDQHEIVNDAIGGKPIAATW